MAIKGWCDGPMWVVGCIDHTGSIVGRACGGMSPPRGDSIMHGPEESNGKRWRWNIWSQEFGDTRYQGYNDRDNMNEEETLAVIDWLVNHKYSDDEVYTHFVRFYERKRNNHK